MTYNHQWAKETLFVHVSNVNSKCVYVTYEREYTDQSSDRHFPASLFLPEHSQPCPSQNKTKALYFAKVSQKEIYRPEGL